MAKIEARVARDRRHLRVRTKVKGTTVRLRLAVFRSLNHIYAQIIDDSRGHTLASAATVDVEVSNAANGKTKTVLAGLVGLARRKEE